MRKIDTSTSTWQVKAFTVQVPGNRTGPGSAWGSPRSGVPRSCLATIRDFWNRNTPKNCEALASTWGVILNPSSL